MNYDQPMIDLFIEHHKQYRNNPFVADGEGVAVLRMDGAVRLCEDWIEQFNVINKQRKALLFANKTMLGCSITLLGVSAYELYRWHKRKKASVEVETQTLDPHPLDTELKEGSWVIDFNDKKGAR